MSPVTKFFRLFYINYILARYGIDEIVLATRWFAPLRFLAYFNPFYYRNRTRPHGERIRLALEKLGPIFVKFGQMLSTRRDLLPLEIANELAKLQDRVPPFSNHLAKKIIEQVYGGELENIFYDFHMKPLASASIAQVHTAKLVSNHKNVIVKILRPGIKRIIKRDVSLLYSFASLLEKFWRIGPRLRPREVVAEFERCLLDELDFMREAANASQLRRNFHHSPELYVPEVYWPYIKKNVLVMEQIHGIPISNLDELNRAGVNLKKLAERGVEIFFTQVFRDCFFHADMHPGNIFVATDNPQEPQYIAVDFGIIGTLSPSDQRYLAENFLAFFKRDYRRVAELHIESGWVPYDTRIEEFESAIRTVCEPIFEKPLKDISCGQVLLNLFQTARRFHMEVQPQLVLLQKTLINIEGLGRQLYPDLDLWSTAKPFLERWLRKQIGIRAALRKVRDQAPFWLEKLPEMPDLFYDAAHFLRELKQERQLTRQRKISHEKQTQRASRNGFMIGIGVALITAVSLHFVVNSNALINGKSINWVMAIIGIAALSYGLLRGQK